MGGREVGRMEWSEGGKWDNCNSIINKYIFLKRMRKTYSVNRPRLVWSL